MIGNIDLYVCDECDSVLLGDECDLVLLGDEENPICAQCEKPMVIAKFDRNQESKLNAEGETISVEAEPPLAYKALCVIEYITSHENIEKERTWFIYEAAHVALGKCLADHAEWVNEVEVLYTNLRAKGLV